MTGSAQLIDAARRGSIDDLMDLIAACEPQIVAAIAIGGIARSSDHFEDAQNQSLLEIWRSASSYTGSSGPCTWMASIARRVTASRIVDPLVRHQKRGSRLRLFSTARVAAGPEDGAATTDLLQRVLGRLTEEHRQVLVLRYMLDQSLEEIASRTGLSPKTVSSRLTRAKRAALSIVAEESDDA
ncbi:MAG: sigma-70 family RNA polymerase sigma factor [Acidimicrobiales bacterium]|nr:sigma-70 family RNA polymerase sigma factor [Acidimicrobiales bacterium]